MMMPTVMHQVLAQSVLIAHAMAVFPRICDKLRMWLRCWIAVPQQTGLRGKRGWWDYRLCWRTSVLSGTTHYMPRGFEHGLESVTLSSGVLWLLLLLSVRLITFKHQKKVICVKPSFNFNFLWSFTAELNSRGCVRFLPGCLQTHTAR